jgi:hypothetical protein
MVIFFLFVGLLFLWRARAVPEPSRFASADKSANHLER